jgi:hypothetical protein
MCALTASTANALPFNAEPIVNWSKSTDLLSFLCDLYDDNAEIIDEAGNRSPVNYRDYGETLFDRGKSSFQKLALEFQTFAESRKGEPDPFGNPIQIDTPPIFLENASFGMMAKHAIAWSAAVEALLSESQFFSLPHILEAEEELNCSLLLAKNVYYKHALQTLRGLLEINVLHVYFVGDQTAYAKWQNADYRIPNLRGKDGLLRKLRDRGTLEAGVSNAVGDLYEELNGSIHSAESKMLHRGLKDRQWAGMQFKAVDFAEWCVYVARVVKVSIQLLAAMLLEIQRQPAIKGIVCDTCRAVNQFAVEGRSQLAITLRCLRCGHQSNFSEEYAAQFGFS